MASNKDSEALYPDTAQLSEPSAPAGQQAIVVTQPPGFSYQTVQIDQPTLGRHGVPLDEYQVGLCDLCHTPVNLFWICCCPCVLGCSIASRLDENACFPFIFGTYPMNVRFRSLAGIKESMCTEACKHVWCPCCSVLRLANEMEERDFQIYRQ